MPTLTVQPSAKDTRIYEGAPTTNYGAGTLLYVQSKTNLNQRSILEFDISGLPAGVTLVSATLSLYVHTIADAVGRTYWAYKLTRTNWAQTFATWEEYDNGLDWTTDGGDYVIIAPVGGSAVVPGASACWMNWNVLAIVQDAYDNTDPAEFLLRDETEDFDATSRYVGFRSKEWVNGATHPKLIITYTTTESKTANMGAKMIAGKLI